MVIESVRKTGLHLQKGYTDAKKLATAVMTDHARVMTETNTTVKVMFVITAPYFVILSGLFHILESMDAKSLVTFAKIKYI